MGYSDLVFQGTRGVLRPSVRDTNTPRIVRRRYTRGCVLPLGETVNCVTLALRPWHQGHRRRSSDVTTKGAFGLVGESRTQAFPGTGVKCTRRCVEKLTTAQ